MKYSIININSKKYGIRSKITINKKSLKNSELFINHMNRAKGLRPGEVGFFRLNDSTRSFKYYTYTNVKKTEQWFQTILLGYYGELKQ